MRKGTDVINKVIVAYDTGEKFSRVKDLVFDQNDSQLLALLVEEAGLFRGAKVVPLHSIKAIGLNAVIVRSKKSVISVNRDERIKQILKRNNILKGTQIMTTDGRHLGQMVDLYFDEQTGAVEGYEVSGGMFADAYTGRSFVPAPETIKIGEHVAFVPVEIAGFMEEQVGGLKGAMLAATTKVQEATQVAGESLQLATQEAKRQAEVSVTNAIVSPTEQKAFVIGKMSLEDVLTPDGMLIVSRGQLISLTDANEAEEKGVLDHLYRSAGGSVRQQASEKIQAATQQTGDRLQTSANHISHRLQQNQRAAIVSMTNAVVDSAAQKAFAIGKFARWSVAAPDGTVIVAADQVVTTNAAIAAEQVGILDELYRSTGGSLSEELTRKANGMVAGYVVEQALGRRVQRIVRLPDGLIVAAEGQIVTQIVIDRAKAYHVEQELLDAVGLSTTEAARGGSAQVFTRTGDRLGATAQSLSEQLYYGAEQAKVTARDLWSQLKQTSHNLQEQWEERRIKQALGRPVTRVILDTQDNVILDVGDLVTHQAIEKAAQAGVLDILLSSVSMQAPDLSQADLRAHKPALASLESAQ